MDTAQGSLLASVAATDDAISLYAWHDGGFARIEAEDQIAVSDGLELVERVEQGQ